MGLWASHKSEWDRGASVLGAFKLDHLLPVKLILFQKLFTESWQMQLRVSGDRSDSRDFPPPAPSWQFNFLLLFRFNLSSVCEFQFQGPMKMQRLETRHFLLAWTNAFPHFPQSHPIKKIRKSRTVKAIEICVRVRPAIDRANEISHRATRDSPRLVTFCPSVKSVYSLKVRVSRTRFFPLFTSRNADADGRAADRESAWRKLHWTIWTESEMLKLNIPSTLLRKDRGWWEVYG